MKTRLLILFFCLFAFNSWAAELKGSCQIDFTGTSTLHDFAGTAVCRPFTIALEKGRDIPYRLVGSNVSVPVAGMDTDNKKRDEKMRGMFDAENFPLISGQVDELTSQVIDKLKSPQGDQNGQLALQLKIRDIELPQTAQVSHIQETEQQLELDLELELSLKAYQLKPPSVLGLIRVGDLVKVKIHLLLEKIGQVPKQILS
jgi:hypothetical protein